MSAPVVRRGQINAAVELLLQVQVSLVAVDALIAQAAADAYADMKTEQARALRDAASGAQQAVNVARSGCGHARRAIEEAERWLPR